MNFIPVLQNTINSEQCRMNQEETSVNLNDCRMTLAGYLRQTGG